MKNLSIESLRSLAWSDFKKNWFFLLNLTILSMFLTGFYGYNRYISMQLLDSGSFEALLMQKLLISSILFFCMTLYEITYTINILDIGYGRKPSWFIVDFYAIIKAMIVSFFIVLPFFLLAFIEPIIVLPENTILGIAIRLISLLISIMSHYFRIRSMFAGMIVLEKKMSILDAFYKSWAMTQDHVWFIIKLMIDQLLMLLLGMVCLGVGVFVAIPVAALMNIHFFKILLHEEIKKV